VPPGRGEAVATGRAADAARSGSDAGRGERIEAVVAARVERR
jgi:hypothetical protein